MEQTENNLVQLSRALQTVHQCNLALIHATDEQELLHSICRILVEFGELRMVWVGYRQYDEDKSIRLMAHAGHEDGYLQDAGVTWADNERGQGPVGIAVRTGKPAWVRNTREDEKFAPWQERAIAHGFASSLGLPLAGGSDIFGVLSLYSEEPDKFNEETLEQYVELADNLAYGITTLRAREERNRAEEALRRSQAYLAEGQRLTHTGSWAWHVARQENVYWSDEQYRIYGFDPQQDPSSYQAAFQRIHPEDQPKFMRRLEKALAGKHDFEMEYRVVLPDGTLKHVQTIGHPVLNGAGEIVELVGTGVDVTEQKRADALLSAEKRILEMIAAGAELKRVLESLCDAVDEQAHNLISTVLLMDSDRQRLWPAAGRRVPEGWSKIITPLKIGPSVGSCGTAAFRKQAVIVTDIASDPLWADYREVALSYDLRACWSRPLISKNQEVLGTLAMYYTEPRKPSESDAALIERAAHVAQIAIERDRSQAALQKAFEEIKALKDKLYEENLALREEIDQASMFEEIVGSSPALQEVLSRVAKVAPSDSTVLITGETGTGKELVARAIHKRSQRARRAFISVNCAAIPSSLIASELFGHEKGAFTGALQRRLGRFELAEGGTIFLDEIGELPQETQVALLRVLQEREFERVGGSQSISVNVRVIAATNRDLAAATAAGTFRLDLFYRLNVFPIDVPPLRQRIEDIPLLVRYFIDRYSGKVGKTITNIEKRTLDLLSGYHWPGNIRELQNVIERSVILCDSGVFSADASWFAAQRDLPAVLPERLNKRLVDQEREMIETALAETKGRVAGRSGAAQLLGIPASTLESKIKALGIKKAKFQGN
ncbi:MAG TPA: sigma 54-interacting transcriptional regulator [Candidatus Acidoferrum sp.]